MTARGAVLNPPEAVRVWRRRARALYAAGAASFAGAGVALVAVRDTSLVVLLISAHRRILRTQAHAQAPRRSRA
jgi:hypothetical protein